MDNLQREILAYVVTYREKMSTFGMSIKIRRAPAKPGQYLNGEPKKNRNFWNAVHLRRGARDKINGEVLK